MQYLGNGQWKISLSGSGIERIQLPETTEGLSEMQWIVIRNEQITEYDLVLTTFLSTEWDYGYSDN